MTFFEILSAVCIWLSATLFSISLQGQTKLRILFVQIFATILYLLNYVFVLNSNSSAWIGAITAGFEILRLIMFYFIGKNNKFDTRKNNLILVAFFCIVLTICTIVNWSGLGSIFPLLAAILVSFALGNKDVKLIKIAFIIQAACITTYLFILGLWLNAISQIMVFIFGIVGLVTMILKEKKLHTENLKENVSQTETNNLQEENVSQVENKTN